MTCDSCGAANAPEARFCGGCGASQARDCPACGQAVARALRFCSACGADVEAVAVGLTVQSAAEWSRTFEAMGWAEDPDPRLHAAFGRLLAQIGIEATEPLVFSTRICDQDWHIKEFRIDGQKVEGQGEKNRRWAKAAVIAGSAVFFPPAALAAFAMKRSDQVWLLATRDRFALLNATDEKVVQWPFASLQGGWVDNKGTFKLFVDDGTVVHFVVKTRGTKLIQAWRITGNMVDGENRYHEYNRDAAVARRQDANLEFMQLLKTFLDEVCSD